MTSVPPAFPDDTPEDPANISRVGDSSNESIPSQPTADSDASRDDDTTPAFTPKTPAKPRTGSSTAAKKKPATPRQPKKAPAAAGSAEAASPPFADTPATPAAKKAAPRAPRAPRATPTPTPAADTDAITAPDADTTASGTPTASPVDAAPSVRKAPARKPAAKTSSATTPAKKTAAGTSARKTPAKRPAAKATDTNIDSTSSTAADPIDAAARPASTPTKKTAGTKAVGSQGRAPRMQSAASISKSPSEIVERVAPPTIDGTDIPPVPPLPVIPPVPPLPDDVAPVADSAAGDPAETGTSVTTDDDRTQGDVTDTDSVATEAMPEADVVPEESDERPPLPEISAEDAALRFETMPDAAEQATGLENHEPQRFVWSKRWPFLSLVPVADIPPVAPVKADDAETDAGSVDGEDADRGAVATTEGWFSADGDRSTETVLLASAVDSGTLPDETKSDETVTDETVVFETAAYAAVSESTPGDVPIEESLTETRVFDEAIVPDADVTSADDSTAVDETSNDDVPTEYLPGIRTDETVEFESGTSEWSWLDDPAPASVDPIADDITIALTTQDDFATEMFAPGAAATALLPTPESNALPVTDTGVTHDDAGDTTDIIEHRAPETGVVSESGDSPVVLSIRNLSRSFGDTIAVNGIDLEVRAGSFYGIVGPNGAGKTTTLSMVTGLLRPDSGSITVNGNDVWKDPDKAKRTIGVLPDRLRLFDRLTGAQLLYYSGVLRGLDGATVRSRVKDLARAFGLEDALNRLVTDYSAGMTKKVALASAMIHSPRLLVLDEPFESVDPVSAANVIEILQGYVANGGTVVLSSHGMDLIQRVCDHVAIIVNGQVLAAGAVDDVRGSGTLEDRFVELAGGRKAAEGMEWLHSFSD